VLPGSCQTSRSPAGSSVEPRRSSRCGRRARSSFDSAAAAVRSSRITARVYVALGVPPRRKPRSAFCRSGNARAKLRAAVNTASWISPGRPRKVCICREMRRKATSAARARGTVFDFRGHELEPGRHEPPPLLSISPRAARMLVRRMLRVEMRGSSGYAADESFNRRAAAKCSWRGARPLHGGRRARRTGIEFTMAGPVAMCASAGGEVSAGEKIPAGREPCARSVRSFRIDGR